MERTMLPPISTLGSSVRVTLVDAYGDGTVWFCFKNSAGDLTTVCIDGREGSPTKHRLFDQARHPSQPDAVFLELGGEEEGLVVGLVSRWLDSNESHKKLTEYGRELITNALVRIGEPNFVSGIPSCNLLKP